MSVTYTCDVCGQEFKNKFKVKEITVVVGSREPDCYGSVPGIVHKIHICNDGIRRLLNELNDIVNQYFSEVVDAEPDEVRYVKIDGDYIINI